MSSTTRRFEKAPLAAPLVAIALFACGSTTEPVSPVEPGPDPELAGGPVADPGEPEEEPDAAPLTKAELARQVFEAVRAHDLDAFVGYLLTADEIQASRPNVTPEEARQLEERILGLNQMMFEEVYAAGEQRGVVWTDAVFREAHQNGSDIRPNIFIVFESGGETFTIKLDDCVQTDRGWLIGDYIDAPQRGESHRNPVD